MQRMRLRRMRPPSVPRSKRRRHLHNRLLMSRWLQGKLRAAPLLRESLQILETRYGTTVLPWFHSRPLPLYCTTVGCVIVCCALYQLFLYRRCPLRAIGWSTFLSLIILRAKAASSCGNYLFIYLYFVSDAGHRCSCCCSSSLTFCCAFLAFFRSLLLPN